MKKGIIIKMIAAEKGRGAVVLMLRSLSAKITMHLCFYIPPLYLPKKALQFGHL